ncbi:hypothetical protein BO70DRAFT_358672 [Aspergillus heteromorphus CBS 117.55]|uniref:RNA recognition motif-containing protein n=1 Tax=Aspergillus heteromorphus CBS 117.55 TaxID=1448321 RepID=A0A317WXR6_9EURO|nr:uncharacterized protein BO70DRAFT_358672 [Aspergillus heteromorphus CBS 117.55]PWY91226.1 hypothetical protein BO70DRAFT_358672 [Aspergillus heteromorphus CBS 117.55]
MPPLPGEERILTVFADIHYYFAAPTPRPLHHRFEKGSYLYLYHNAVHQKVRVEVANNPGALEQDAFNGALENVHLRHSTRFPTLCTVTVDGQIQSQLQNQMAFPPPPGAISQEWKLSHTDPLNLLPIHTMDIYFWTTDDANQFLDLFETHLPQSQIETDRHPYPPPPHSTVSSVVQQLETVAITDPGYQNGQTRNSQAEVVPNPIPNYQAITPPSNLPPPPPLGAPPTAAMHPLYPAPVPAPAPLPYNPAAPAAPEPIKHREKTPPPDDGETGTGLTTAAIVDTYPSSSQMPAGVGMGVGIGGAASGALPSPPLGPPPYSMPGSYGSPPPSAAPLNPQQQQQQQQQQQSPPPPPQMPMTFAPPPTDPNPTNPNAHLLYTQQQLPLQPQQHQLQQQQHRQSGAYSAPRSESPPSPPTFPPLGGYAQYSYETPQRHASVSSNDFSIHNQLYRPTELESTSRHQKFAKEAMQKPGDRPQTFVKAAYKVEGGVNRFLRKLEKRL